MIAVFARLEDAAEVSIQGNAPVIALGRCTRVVRLVSIGGAHYSLEGVLRRGFAWSGIVCALRADAVPAGDVVLIGRDVCRRVERAQGALL